MCCPSTVMESIDVHTLLLLVLVLLLLLVLLLVLVQVQVPPTGGCAGGRAARADRPRGPGHPGGILGSPPLRVHPVALYPTQPGDQRGHRKSRSPLTLFLGLIPLASQEHRVSLSTR